MTRINATTLSEGLLRVARRLFDSRRAGILMGTEFLLLTCVYAIFMFSDRVPRIGLAALGFLWIVRWWITGRLTLATPMDMPIVGILIMLPVSLYVSTDWSLTLPKMYGVILGVAIFYAVVNAINTVLKMNLAIAGLILLSIAVSGLGLVGADWLSNKLFSLQAVYELLPRLVKAVPRSIAGGIHPNIMGGALAFFIPLLASLLWDGWELKIMPFVKNARLADMIRVSSRLVLFFSLVITSVTLLLTQSRGAIAGVSIGLFVLAALHDRRFLWVIPLAILGLVVTVQLWGSGNLAAFLSRMDTTGGGTLPGRLEIWQRAIYMIQDFPFTGVGIGTFDPVAHALYPFFLVGPVFEIPHAHNMLLEVAVDLGIPGLVFYVALLSAFAFSAWRLYQKAARPLRALIVGLACGMLAHQIFGIMDAFMLGTKLGAVMWLFFGLVTALYICQDQLAMEITENDAEVKKAVKSSVLGSSTFEGKSGAKQWLRRLGNFFLPFVYWALFSLLGISFVGSQPYISLAIAVAGGVILGFICVKATESRNLYNRME